MCGKCFNAGETSVYLGDVGFGCSDHDYNRLHRGEGCHCSLIRPRISNMKVNIYFPWRETPDRVEAFEVTKEKVLPMYFFDGIYTVDSGHRSFNRAASRNLAAEHARENCDVMVLCDADSIPEQQPLLDAIASASDGLMHFPFHEVWYIEKKGMIRARAGAYVEQIRSRIIDKCQSEGGVWVCEPKTWWKAGGMDDRLRYWGCDDRSFLAASRTLVGMPVKHEGVLLCLPHERQSGDAAWHPPDVLILLEYEGAYQQPEKMKEVIDARRAYLSGAVSGETEECSPVIRSIPRDLYC